MNRETARIILEAYPPSGGDPECPAFKEALDFANTDPELAKWFAEQQAIDSRFEQRISEFPVPPDLKPRLLAARTTTSFLPRWRQPAWLATAAAFLLLAVPLAGLLSSKLRGSTLDQFRVAMIEAAASSSPHVESESLDLNQARSWLAARNGEPNFQLPEGLNTHASVYCKILSWHRRNVSLLCFHQPNGGHLDLFIINANHLPNSLIPATPVLAFHNNQPTATWQTGGQCYFLLGPDNTPASEIQRLLASHARLAPAPAPPSRIHPLPPPRHLSHS